MARRGLLDPERHEGWVWTRVMWAICALLTWLPRGAHLEETYSTAGIVLTSGRVGLTRWIIFSPPTAWAVFGALVAGALLVAVGRWVRVGMALYLTASCLLLFHEGLNMKAYDRLMFWQGLSILLAPAAAARTVEGNPGARLMMLLTYCGLYGMTGWNKILEEPRWWQGLPLAYDLLDRNFAGGALAAWMSDKMWLVAPMAWVTLIFEASFPVLAWVRRLRPWLLLIAGSFHLGIMVLMNVNTFSLVALSAYPVLLEPEDFARLRDGLKRILRIQ